MKLFVLPTLALLAGAAALASAGPVDYVAWSTQPQRGDGTFYGQGGDDRAGACSFSENFADTNGLAWTRGVVTTIALNDAQFAAGAACGLCIKYRGIGEGLGTTPISTAWARGFVNNRCPECQNGDIDLNIAGDGRWRVEWYATPCDVGESKLHFKVVVSNPFWASFVISNTAAPVAAVQVRLGDGAWQDLTRAFNNQWAIHGDWRGALPIPVRVTAVTGETVEDAITGEVTEGTVQFTADGDVETGAGAATPGYGTKPAGREFAS